MASIRVIDCQEERKIAEFLASIASKYRPDLAALPNEKLVEKMTAFINEFDSKLFS